MNERMNEWMKEWMKEWMDDLGIFRAWRLEDRVADCSKAGRQSPALLPPGRALSQELGGPLLVWFQLGVNLYCHIAVCARFRW